MAHKNKSLVADMDATENMKGYMACSIELDRALEYLIKRLEEKGIADKTVIALAADHYPYGMKDDLVAEIGAEANKWYGLQDSNLILWSASMTEPVYIDKVCSSVDVIPTLLNLLGIDYDSRLYSGKDILSDSPGLIVFNDMGFMTDYCIYNSSTGEVKETAGVTVPKEYIDQINSLIKNMWNASGKLIQVDYYEKMKNYIK
ncbi:MAG: sulfatase-like hydrolase/transferase [Lachnospiraceae bacterium]|nr:sulfatase-like hydrolase/transferase [Lachnospiraceae bacterium]